MVSNYERFKSFQKDFLGGDRKSVWKIRNACLQACAGYEFEETRVHPKLHADNGLREGAGKRKPIRLGDSGSGSRELVAGVERLSTQNSFPTNLYSLCRPRGLYVEGTSEVDEFRNLLSSPITITERSWNEIDDSEDVQRDLFAGLDAGILILRDIPKIPEEYEYGSKAFYGFDSEDNGYGLPHFYQFAWRDGVAFSHSFRLLARWACREFNLKRNNHVIWCTNLEYDFGNALKDWDSEAFSLDIRWRRGKLAKAQFLYDPGLLTWGDPEDGIGAWTIWDTLNHWKISVEQMGRQLSELFQYDFSKLEKDFWDFRYAAMDAIISRGYALVQRRGYESRNIPLKLTPGATALEWYMKGRHKSGRRFCNHQLYNTHTEEELTWLMPALRGGRTEVFSQQKITGKIGYFDINSAYPYTMSIGTFPDLQGHRFISGHDEILKHIEGKYEGVVDCEIDASNVISFAKIIPYLGTIEKEHGRFVFPLGKWRDKYTFFEIRKAISYGYSFKFIDARVYDRAVKHPFKDYVDEAYGLRLEGNRTGDKVLKDIGKSLGNNLFGKFGQRLVFTKLVDPSEFDPEDIREARTLGGAVILETDEGFAKHSNVIWGAYITAMTRDLLYNYMIEAMMDGNEVLYCDTDSIFIAGGKWPKSDPEKLGALKHEGDLTYFEALLPKTYIYEMGGKLNYKAKGVPAQFQQAFLTKGRVEFKKPMKVREALVRKNFHKEDQEKGLKSGMPAVNAWVTVSKELSGNYTKRLVNSDKTTSPLILSF